MSTPVGKPARSNILDYAPRHLREAGPRRVDEDAIPPRRTADDEPLDDKRPEDEPYDIPLAPEAPDDEIRAEADQYRDDASEDEDAVEDEGEDATDEGRAYRIHAHGLGEPQDGREESSFDEDIAQLAALLESIRRGEPGEPPASPPRRAAARPPQGGERSSEVYIDGVHVPRSLQPSYVPPPPEHGTGVGKIIGGITGACLLAAALAFFMVGNWQYPTRPAAVPVVAAPAHKDATAAADRPNAPDRGVRLAATPAPYTVASAATTAVAPPAAGTQQAKLAAVSPVVRVAPTQAPAPAPWPTNTPASAAPTAPPSAPAVPTTAPPPQPAAATPPPPRPHLTMDAGQIKLLLDQGKQFIAAGDLATARTVLQRVADADVPAGALALAETYDPAVLAKQGVRGLRGDVEQARHWYQRARQLGSDEAGHRLAQFATP